MEMRSVRPTCTHIIKVTNLNERNCGPFIQQRSQMRVTSIQVISGCQKILKDHNIQFYSEQERNINLAAKNNDIIHNAFEQTENSKTWFFNAQMRSAFDVSPDKKCLRYLILITTTKYAQMEFAHVAHECP